MTLPKFSFKGCYLNLSEPLFLQKLVELTCRKARSLGRRVKRKETAKEKKKGPLLNNSQNARLLGRGRYGI